MKRHTTQLTMRTVFAVCGETPSSFSIFSSRRDAGAYFHKLDMEGQAPVLFCTNGDRWQTLKRSAAFNRRYR